MSKKQEQGKLNTDREAPDFEEIAKRYDKVISAIARGFDVPDSEREDLYQEGLIALYRAFLTYDSEISVFSTYAGTCIKRAMLTWIRDHGRNYSEISLDNEAESVLVDDNEGPEELYLSKESIAGLKKKALTSLSDYEKCVFLLYLQEMSAQEIADSLGRSRKSAENALDRIRKKLSRNRK